MKKLFKVKINYYFDLLLFLFLAVFPMFSTKFRIEQMSRYLCYVILIFSLDLLWGYAGTLSLGHSVLFGLGGYIYALSYSLKDGQVPTFMKNAGVNEVPGFMNVLSNQTAGVILAIVIPAVFAFLLGLFLFSSKVGGMFFAVITFALVTLANLFLNNQSAFTGGANGITKIGRFVIGGKKLTISENYYFILVAMVLTYLFCRWLTKSKFGKVVIATSENDQRVKFLGYKTALFKAFLYAISGMLAGLAGVLFVPVSGIIAPTDVTGTLSTILVIALAVGGKGCLTGGALGIILIEWAQSMLSESFSNVWQLILGLLVIFIVFFVPEGFMGKVLGWQEKNLMKRKEAKHG